MIGLKACVFVCLSIFVVITTSQRCKPHSQIPEWPSERFCPNECFSTTTKQRNRCRSIRNQYKCSAMYYNLPNQGGRKYRWIAGLPDVLSREKVRNSEEIRRTFGGLTKKSFYLLDGKCSDEIGNARCYAAMLKASQFKLDQYDKSIINEDGTESYGDILCDNLYRNGWIPTNTPRIDNITIAFRYSACSGPWRDISDGNKPMTTDQKLCCKREAPVGSGRPKFKFAKCTQ